MKSAILSLFLLISLLMLRNALTIVAAHGSVLVGSDRMVTTTSGHLIALVVLKVDINIMLLSFINDLAAGKVHSVLCIIFGITHVAIAFTRLS